jgi:hypothetical protein
MALKKTILTIMLLLSLIVTSAIATVSSSTSRVSYNANGALTSFTFTFGIGATSDLQVILTDSDGVETTLTETTHYTVSCTNSDCESGGSVVTVATYAAGNTITILRNIDITQESDFTENQPTLYETFEDALDKITRIDQQQSEEIDRSVKLKKTYSPSSYTVELTPEASKVIGWNSGGSALTNYATTTVYANRLACLNDDYGNSLATAYSDIGSDNVTVLVERDTTVSADLTLGSNINLMIINGAQISIASTKTLTIYSPANITASANQQIFTGDGTAAFTAGGEVYPEWWGIDGTADQTEINKAIVSMSSTHGVVKLGVKNYSITGQILVYTGTVINGSTQDVSSGTLSTTISSTYDGYAIAVASTAAETYSVALKDFKIILNSTGLTAMGGVDWNYVSSSIAENIIITLTGGNSTNAGFIIGRVSSKGGYYNRIIRCKAIATVGQHFDYGFATYGGCNQNVIDHFDARRCDTSVYLGGAHNTVSNLNSESTITNHIRLINGTGYGNHLILSPYLDSEATSIGILNDAIVGSHIINPYYVDLGTNFSAIGNCTVNMGMNKPSYTAATYGTTVAAWDALKFGVIGITVTDSVPFTISNPTNGHNGAVITIIINNDSGGAMGKITWGSAFVLRRAFINPTDGNKKAITFRRFGSYWEEESRQADELVAASPTSGMWTVGDTVWSSAPAASSPPGWTCVFVLNTTLTEEVSASETADITVTSIASVVAGDVVGIRLDDGSIYWDTVGDVTGGDLTLAGAGPASVAASGNAVYFFRFKAMANLAA